MMMWTLAILSGILLAIACAKLGALGEEDGWVPPGYPVAIVVIGIVIGILIAA